MQCNVLVIMNCAGIDDDDDDDGGVANDVREQDRVATPCPFIKNKKEMKTGNQSFKQKKLLDERVLA